MASLNMDFKRFVNNLYLDENIQKEMRKIYLQSGVLKLEEFLKREVYNELIKLFEGIKGEKFKIADRYSYYARDDLNGVEKLFCSNEFLDFARTIIGEEFDKAELKIKIFGQGDYTLLHDSSYKEDKFEFFFIFCWNWDEKYRGEIVYTDNEENGRTLIFPVVGNNLVLIHKNGLGNFVKYINHLAENRKFILIRGVLE